MQATEFLTTVDAAAALGVTKQHLAKLVKRDVITPALRANGLRGAMFFHRDEVARVAAERNLS